VAAKNNKFIQMKLLKTAYRPKAGPVNPVDYLVQHPSAPSLLTNFPKTSVWSIQNVLGMVKLLLNLKVEIGPE